MNDDIDAWTEVPDGSAVSIDDMGVHITPFQPEKRASAGPQAPVTIPA